MKKMFLFLIGAALFSCTGTNQSSKVVKAASSVTYGIDKNEASAFFLNNGYKKLTLSTEQMLDKLGDIEMLKVWLTDGVGRTSALGFTTTIGKTSVPMLAFFDQEQLFAQFIPAVTLPQSDYEALVAEFEAALGLGETQNNESSLSSSWILDDDRVFISLFYDIENTEFFLISLNEDIQANNDLALFNNLTPEEGWFLSSFIGDSYNQVIENTQNIYRMPVDQSSVVYAAKLDNITLLYHYLFDETDSTVRTIIFQNMETKEAMLADIFSTHFNQQPTRSSRSLNENFSQTTYEWDLGDDVGALIVLLEQTIGDQSFPQSYALISKDFTAIKAELQI